MTGASADFLVIGAGIAGMSAAAALATHGAVIVLEAEDRPGRHATGRSAAFFAPGYGNETVRALTAPCEAFFRTPPEDFSEALLLRPRDCTFIARPDQRDALRDMAQELGPSVALLSTAEVQACLPMLRGEYVAGALIDRRGVDLDVDALLQAYQRLLRQRGGAVVCDAGVRNLRHFAGLWHAATPAGAFEAPVVVNAAGAWADDLAQRAGLSPLGIEPKRRTAILVDPPPGWTIEDWPLVIDVDEQFYFKPDAGRILISPADETPSLPGDAQPDELDVAIAVDRFERAVAMSVRRVGHKWAGLRSFAPDRTPVAGFDPHAHGFFWLAGQGGYGVQTAPALSEFARHAITHTPLQAGFESLAPLTAALSPARFATP